MLDNRELLLYDYMLQVCYSWYQSGRGNRNLGLGLGATAWRNLTNNQLRQFKSALLAGNVTKFLFQKAQAIVQATDKFELLVIFGDSLSDQGRMYHRALGMFRGFANLIDSGTGAFSDGINWVDRIMVVAVLSHIITGAVNPNNKNLKSPLDLREATLRRRLKGSKFNRLKFDGEYRALNFAEGGASSEKGTKSFVRCILKTLKQEREEFLNWWGDRVKKNRQRGWTDRQIIEYQQKVRFFEMTGANDLVTTNYFPTFYSAKIAVDARIRNVIELYNKGFTHFMLGTLPDLSLSPKFQAGSWDKQELLYRISRYFNRYLQERVRLLLDDPLYKNLSIDLYNINHPFVDTYVNGLFNPGQQPQAIAGAGARNRFQAWRENRTWMTQEIDKKLYDLLNLSRDEYDDFLSVDMREAGQNQNGPSLAVKMVDPSASDDASTALVDEYIVMIEGTREFLREKLLTIDDDIREERSQSMPNRLTAPLTKEERKERHRRQSKFKDQRSVLKKVRHHLLRLVPTERDRLIALIRESFDARKRVFFYNRLHPSALLYNLIAKDASEMVMISPPITRGWTREKRIGLDVVSQSERRNHVVAYIHLREAKEKLEAFELTNPHGLNAQEIQGLKAVIDSFLNQFPLPNLSSDSYRDVTDRKRMSLIASFLREHFDVCSVAKIASIAGVFDPNKSIFNNLKLLCREGLFSARHSQIRPTFEKLEWFASVTHDISYRMVNERGMALTEAVAAVYEEALLEKRHIKSIDKSNRTDEQKRFRHRLKAFRGLTLMLTVRHLMFRVNSTALKDFMNEYPGYFAEQDRRNGLVAEMSLTLENRRLTPESVDCRLATLILQSGIFSSSRSKNHTQERGIILGKAGLSRQKRVSRKFAVNMVWDECRPLSRDNRNHNTLFDRLVDLLPRA